MSKQYNIRWGRSDASRLSHLTRKVNKKIFEIEVRRPDITDYQPEYLDYYELKGKIKTRRDFNNLINHYERYLRDGAEELETRDGKKTNITKWEAKEFKIVEGVSNRRKAEKLVDIEAVKEKEVTIAGEGTGQKRVGMGKIEEVALNPSDRDPFKMDRESFERAFRQMEREMFDSYDDLQRAKKMRHYVKGLIAEGYSDDIIKLLERVDKEDFENIFMLDEVATIDFIYDPQELKVKEEKLRELWTKHAKDKKVNTFDYKEINDEISNEYASGERIKGQGRIRKPKRRRRR